MAHDAQGHTLAPAAAAKPQLSLPVLVATPVDLGRLLREIETIDETLLQLGLRKPGSEIKMPKTSQLMDHISEQNKLNLLQPEDRKALQAFLTSIKEQAPVLHMSFSSDPNTAFIEKLMAWLRREINPYLLITIGLQPNIGAGCIVRSTNKYFDMSLRQDFANKTELLREALTKLPATETAPEPATQGVAA
ncbi:MAG TPA: hypothetical protein VG604_01575 [Candidatus Saccharimonadales bacterium]|nr:hypothetical protein [Candidatus Saccharimonadales bacterium]